MALVTYNRTSLIRESLNRILSNNGYSSVNNSPFLGSIVSAISSALTGKYDQVYSIAANVDIGRASGEYLDRWGRFLDEPRTIPSYASDMSLTNTYITLSPEVNAGTITVDGGGISLPRGISITDESGRSTVQTVDDIYIRADRSRAYCRVVATIPGTTFIRQGVLTTVGVNLTEMSNILPSAVSVYKFAAGNSKEIVGGESLANDQTYQYILQQKAKSIGLFNENKVNSVLDLESVVSINIQEYTGGAVVYLDTTDPLLTENVVQSANMLLRQYRTLGQSIQVYTPIIRRLKLRLQVEVKNPEYLSNTLANITSYIVTNISSTKMGASVAYKDVVDNSKTMDQNIAGIRILSATLDGRVLTASQVSLYYNERMSTASGDITIV